MRKKLEETRQYAYWIHFLVAEELFHFKEEPCCGNPPDKPCAIGACPYFIKLTEACNCSRRLCRGLSQAETGRALKISRARVGQLEKSALRKVYDCFGDATLADILPLKADVGELHPVPDRVAHVPAASEAL